MRLRLVRVECLPVFPHCEDCEVVGTRRGLLEYVVSHIAFVLPTLFGQTLKQRFSFVFALRRDVDMRHYGYHATFDRRRPRINRETEMHALIERACASKDDGSFQTSMITKRFGRAIS